MGEKAEDQYIYDEVVGLFKKGLKKFGKMVWRKFGGAILAFLAIFTAVSMLIILIMFIPSMSFKYAAQKLMGIFVSDSATDTNLTSGDWGSPFGTLTLSDVGGRISSQFGPRTAPTEGASTWHKGVDVGVPSGTQVVAAASGTVSYAGNTGGGAGIMVSIQTADGYTFTYMHLSSVSVSAGQTVQRGDPVGKTGNTGTSTGPHLHFQVQAPEGVGTQAPDGKWFINPESFVTGRSSGTPPDSTDTTGGTGDSVSSNTTANPTDISQYESYWYNAANVKAKLDEVYETISDMNNGMQYLTKDNFNMVLDRVIAYVNSVRVVTNTYTYYHHYFHKEITNVYSKNTDETETSDNSNSVSAQGEGENEVTRKETVESKEVGGKTVEVHTEWKITDYVHKNEQLHVINRSPEDDPIFKVSWEEIFTTAAMKSVVQEGREDIWVNEAKLTETEKPDINGVSRLDEETVRQLIEAFEFQISYYFDPTSSEKIPGTNESYAEHIYNYDEMENYAYVHIKPEIEEVEHGTETLETDNFDYKESKIPAIAPAYAVNAYTSIEYDYTPQSDGTAVLAGRYVIIDGIKFYEYMKSLLGEDFKMEWFVQFLEMLPGSHYDAGNGDLSTRFARILESYKSGEPYKYYDTDFQGVGLVTLGINCDRTPEYTPREDGEGNPIVIPDVPLNLTVDDIDDEQIRRDIAAGLYTLEDLVYGAACIQAEAGSVDGQVAVMWCIRNRLASGNYGSIKDVVTAPGQFSSPWAQYLNGSFSKQAQSVAAAVLKGQVENPIGSAYFFFSARSCWGHLPGVWYRNVGGNMFYNTWGDVTQVVGRTGYVPF